MGGRPKPWNTAPQLSDILGLDNRSAFYRVLECAHVHGPISLQLAARRPLEIYKLPHLLAV